jgi:ABC-2 type transport system ATP-binding protein
MQESETAPSVAPQVVPPVAPQVALRLRGLTKRFGETTAVDNLDLDVPRGSFYGLVGPNGAGKTTTLSMATGLLRPDAGTAQVLGTDVWADPVGAKSQIGILPDGLRLFDRLTGQQLVTYAGLLRGMDRAMVAERTGELLAALGLTDAAEKLVIDYSAGMTKKITLACALVHAPRLLVLDEPFEAVDPVSARTIRRILEDFAANGGTVVLSIIAAGVVLSAGTLDDVRAGVSLEDRFLGLVGGSTDVEGLAWLRTSSD